MKMAEAFLANDFKQFNRLENRLIVSVIVFCFAFLFLFLFKPFGMDYWISDTFGKRSFILLFICLYAFAIILISQFIQHLLFKKQEYKFRYFLTGIFSEVIAISVPLAYLSTNEHSSFFNEMIVTTRLISVTLILCYFVAWLIWISFRKGQQEQNLLMEKPEEPLESLSDAKFQINDDSGNTRFEIEACSLLYLTSEDNYVMIHYISDGVSQKKLIRATLKSIEDEASRHGCIRCHRSFIVNQSMIRRVKRIGRNYHIQLQHSEESIPVSKSYESHFMAFFQT